MTVDYRELNKVIPPRHAAVPSIAGLINTLSHELGTYHYVVDLANAFFSIDIEQESQEQFAFTCEGPSFHRDTLTAPPSVMDL